MKSNSIKIGTNKNLVLGISCVLLAAFGFGLHGAFVRLAGDVPLFEKTLFRNFVIFCISLAVILKNDTKLEMGVFKANIKPLFFRAFFGSLGIFCNYYALSNLNIADATMLNKMSPFFALIFSIFILNERPKLVHYILFFVALSGAVLVIKPGGTNLSAFPALIGLIGGVGAGMAYTFIRYLTKNNVSGNYIILFFSAFSILINIPLLLLDFKLLTFSQFVYLILSGVFAALGQYGITYAYKLAPAKEISVYDYSQVIFSAILGYFLFGQVIDSYSIIGYLLIIGAGILMFRANHRIR